LKWTGSEILFADDFFGPVFQTAPQIQNKKIERQVGLERQTPLARTDSSTSKLKHGIHGLFMAKAGEVMQG